MALVGIELETLVSVSDALTTRPPPCLFIARAKVTVNHSFWFIVLCAFFALRSLAVLLKPFVTI